MDDFERLELEVELLKTDLVGNRRFEGDIGRVGKLEKETEAFKDFMKTFKSGKALVVGLVIFLGACMSILKGCAEVAEKARGIVQ